MSRQFYASAKTFTLVALFLVVLLKLNCVDRQLARSSSSSLTQERAGRQQQQQDNHATTGALQGSAHELKRIKSSARPEGPRHAAVQKVYQEKKRLMMMQEHQEKQATINERNSIINVKSKILVIELSSV